MRTQMLSGLALVVGAVAFLGGADVARAQVWPGYAPAYAQGYGSGYPSAPTAYGYAGYGQGVRAAGYPGYYQGYGYQNYAYSYPNYYYNYPRYYAPYQYPQTAGAPAAPLAAPTPSAVVLPLLDGCEHPGDDGPTVLGTGPAEPIVRDHVWLSAAYDAGFIKPWAGTVALVTQGSVNDAHPGALGQPGTVVVDTSRADFGLFNGVRVEGGLFLDDDERLSLEWTGRYLIPNNVRFAASSDANGNPLLGRPIFDILDGHESAGTASFPGLSSGSITTEAHSEFLGAEFNAACHFRPSDCVRIDALLGFRFLRLQESLTLRDQIQPLVDGVFSFQGTPIPAVDSLSDVDSFRTLNRFYGLQVGSHVSWEGRWLYASLFGKIGVGANDQEVDINGSSALATPTGPIVAGGGVLAQASNIGVHTQTALSIVPEGGVNVGVKITPHLRLTAGYSFLYWSSVVRPANQIDHNVNLNQTPTASPFVFGQAFGPGPLVPAFRFNDENFWVHSFNVGLDLHF